MKRLVCEICESHDFLKQDGLFVCQGCGTKYTTEEVKKLMVEVEGDIPAASRPEAPRVSNIEQYLQNARRARQKEDWNETERLYGLAEREDPSNVEAIFYGSYGKAKASLVDSDLYKRQAVFKVLQNCVVIIGENIDISKEEENLISLREISNEINNLSGSTYVYNERKNGYGTVVWTDMSETVSLFNNLHASFAEVLLKLVAKYPVTSRMKTLPLYSMVLEHYNFVQQHASTIYRQHWTNQINQVQQKMNELLALRAKLEAADRAAREQVARAEQKKRTQAYWENHKEEQDALLAEQAANTAKLDELNCQAKEVSERVVPRINQLTGDLKKKLPVEDEFEAQRTLIYQLEVQKAQCGVFKAREKKELQERLDTVENPKLVALRQRADAEKQEHQRRISAEINALRNQLNTVREEISQLQSRNEAIDRELTRDR